MVSRKAAVVLAVAVLSSSLPGRLYAQSAIAGVVRDTTGGVLPGVPWKRAARS